MFNKSITSLFTASLMSAAISAEVVAQQANLDKEAWAIEEVVVTAQKRAQSAQDVGISVAAMSGDQLREQGISKAEDLANVIPNVSSLNTTGGGVPILIVRGVGLQNFRLNDSPTTAFYVDEVYQTSIASAEFSMFDLERVELLKGPQGGLYGRNTISGAMQVISEKPDPEAGVNGYVDAGYGEHGRTKLEGAVGMPLSETAAVRVAGRWEQSDDTEYKSVTNDFTHGETDKWAARAMLSMELSDNVSVLAKLHGGADNSELPLTRPLGLYAPGSGPVGGAACEPLGGADCQHVWTGASNTDYGVEGRYDSASDLGGYLDNEWLGGSVIAEFELSDNLVLTSISAYDEMDLGRVIDLDGLPIEFMHVTYGSELEAWSQEFRLAYDADSFSVVGGVNYAKDDLKEHSVVMGREGLIKAAFGGADGLDQKYDQSTEALAAYAHAEWQFSEGFNLITELRHTDAEKTFKGDETLIFGTALVPFIPVDDSKSFSAWSGKLALEWSISDDMMAYTSVSDGFKTGGFYGGFATSSDEMVPYESETILAYELGLKSDWMDGRLRANGSVFVYDREDVQQTATTASGVSRLTNVGDVDVQGAELDLTYLATEKLSLALGFGYTDSELVASDLFSATPATSTRVSIEGTNTPNYSKYNWNLSAKYETDLTDDLYGRAQLEYSYRSHRDLNLVTNASEAPALVQPAYDLINLRLAVGSESDAWEASFFVENLTDEEYKTAARTTLRGMYDLYGESRTWGLAVNYRFSE